LTLLSNINMAKARTWTRLQNWLVSSVKRVEAPPDVGERLDLHLQRLFAFLEINCVLDVGANRGQYGRFLRDSGYQGHIVSFEPSPNDFAVLRQQSQHDPLWQIHNYGLGDTDETLRLNITTDSLFNSFLQPNEFILTHGIVIDNVVEVPVRRLDDILDEVIAGVKHPAIYLKLDTQGYDLKVMEGAKNICHRLSGLQSEISLISIYEESPGYLESIARLSKQGFSITGLFPIARDNGLRVVEFDCVMIHDSKAGETLSLHPPDGNR
jgi:FkbM family methyltransferase